MMMTKPAPSAEQENNDQTSESFSSVKKKASPEDAVKDLEKRLQMLETATPASTTTTNTATEATSSDNTMMTMTMDEPTPSAAVAAAPAATAAPKAGKNALLARIMAAQERAKQPPPPADLLDSFDAPAESESAPPPPFDVSLLPPQSQPTTAPPAFDATMLPTPSETQSTGPSVSWDPHLTAAAAPPAASAPVFEDLLDPQEEDQKMPPPSYQVTPVAPPTEATSAGGLDQDAINAIMSIEGLSDKEKAEIIAEQEKIMASMEQEKKNKAPANSAAARANAFEQRSHAAAVQALGGGSTKSPPRTVDLGDGNEVALHGQNKTFEAIKNGTAVMVQCLSCENWMQVTGHATMMFCPVCQTVSPVASADDKAAANQMAADMELAEQLQKEEYKKVEKRQAAAAAKKQQQSCPKQEEGSWMEWLGFGTPAPAPPQAPPSFAQKPVGRGEIAVSLPPGASRNNAALAMAPAYTGQEEEEPLTSGSSSTPAIQFSSSRDESVDSDVGPQGARVAKQQPLFSCVADSISSAAGTLYNAVSADEQGNVHGVDTSGLLGISQAGRQNDNNSGYQNMS